MSLEDRFNVFEYEKNDGEDTESDSSEESEDILEDDDNLDYLKSVPGETVILKDQNGKSVEVSLPTLEDAHSRIFDDLLGFKHISTINWLSGEEKGEFKRFLFRALKKLFGATPINKVTKQKDEEYKKRLLDLHSLRNEYLGDLLSLEWEVRSDLIKMGDLPDSPEKSSIIESINEKKKSITTLSNSVEDLGEQILKAEFAHAKSKQKPITSEDLEELQDYIISNHGLEEKFDPIVHRFTEKLVSRIRSHFLETIALRKDVKSFKPGDVVQGKIVKKGLNLSGRFKILEIFKDKNRTSKVHLSVIGTKIVAIETLTYDELERGGFEYIGTYNSKNVKSVDSFLYSKGSYLYENPDIVFSHFYKAIKQENGKTEIVPRRRLVDDILLKDDAPTPEELYGNQRSVKNIYRLREKGVYDIGALVLRKDDPLRKKYVIINYSSSELTVEPYFKKLVYSRSGKKYEDYSILKIKYEDAVPYQPEEERRKKVTKNELLGFSLKDDRFEQNGIKNIFVQSVRTLWTTLLRQIMPKSSKSKQWLKSEKAKGLFINWLTTDGKGLLSNFHYEKEGVSLEQNLSLIREDMYHKYHTFVVSLVENLLSGEAKKVEISAPGISNALKEKDILAVMKKDAEKLYNRRAFLVNRHSHPFEPVDQKADEFIIRLENGVVIDFENQEKYISDPMFERVFLKVLSSRFVGFIMQLSDRSTREKYEYSVEWLKYIQSISKTFKDVAIDQIYNFIIDEDRTAILDTFRAFISDIKPGSPLDDALSFSYLIYTLLSYLDQSSGNITDFGFTTPTGETIPIIKPPVLQYTQDYVKNFAERNVDSLMTDENVLRSFELFFDQHGDSLSYEDWFDDINVFIEECVSRASTVREFLDSSLFPYIILSEPFRSTFKYFFGKVITRSYRISKAADVTIMLPELYAIDNPLYSKLSKKERKSKLIDTVTYSISMALEDRVEDILTHIPGFSYKRTTPPPYGQVFESATAAVYGGVDQCKADTGTGIRYKGGLIDSYNYKGIQVKPFGDVPYEDIPYDDLVLCIEDGLFYCHSEMELVDRFTKGNFVNKYTGKKFPLDYVKNVLDPYSIPVPEEKDAESIVGKIEKVDPLHEYLKDDVDEYFAVMEKPYDTHFMVRLKRLPMKIEVRFDRKFATEELKRKILKKTGVRSLEFVYPVEKVEKSKRRRK